MRTVPAVSLFCLLPQVRLLNTRFPFSVTWESVLSRYASTRRSVHVSAQALNPTLSSSAIRSITHGAISPVFLRRQACSLPNRQYIRRYSGSTAEKRRSARRSSRSVSGSSITSAQKEIWEQAVLFLPRRGTLRTLQAHAPSIPPVWILRSPAVKRTYAEALSKKQFMHCRAVRVPRKQHASRHCIRQVLNTASHMTVQKFSQIPACRCLRGGLKAGWLRVRKPQHRRSVSRDSLFPALYLRTFMRFCRSLLSPLKRRGSFPKVKNTAIIRL